MLKFVTMIFTVCCLLNTNYAKAQDILGGKISGSFQSDIQYYTKDSIIGASDVKEKILSNTFFYLNYTVGNFNAGVRYEAYLNPLLGIDPRYKGSGIGYRFAEYSTDFLDATIGNFYEQFGSGMILRAYEDRLLGFDNSIDGLRFRLRPIKGIEIIGLIGNQRSFWSTSKGIVRGGNIALSVNNLFEKLLPETFQVNLGGSVVSKYQDVQGSSYNLPQNVLAYSTRLSLSGKEFMFETEYGYKYNDPDAVNKYNFNPGKGLYVTASYYPSGFGATGSFHVIDNMDFRSDRDAQGNNLTLNFFPPLTKQHLYRLATMYPYATKLNGEIGAQGEITYSIPKELFGDKYGATLTMNFSQVNSIDTTTKIVDSVDHHVYTYDSKMFGLGKKLYYRDFSIEFSKRWTVTTQTSFSFISTKYNKDVLENEGAPKYGTVDANIGAGELIYTFAKKHSIRFELQHMWSSQDTAALTKNPDNINGNWLYGLAEYSIAPSWFFSIYDEYNYGNHDTARRVHYPGATVAFIHSTTRVSLGYGRQRGGILCVGGVCRPVPASNGILLSITSSF